MSLLVPSHAVPKPIDPTRRTLDVPKDPLTPRLSATRRKTRSPLSASRPPTLPGWLPTPTYMSGFLSRMGGMCSKANANEALAKAARKEQQPRGVEDAMAVVKLASPSSGDPAVRGPCMPLLGEEGTRALRDLRGGPDTGKEHACRHTHCAWYHRWLIAIWLALGSTTG